jgi:plastocyanin
VATKSGSSGALADRVVSVGLQDESANYAFDPGQLTFAKGETVTIELTSQNEFHSFTVDSLGLDVEVEAGESTSVTYTFDTAGTYDLICIPHESLGMVGTITVQ